jgi:hypothetical protein
MKRIIVLSLSLFVSISLLAQVQTQYSQRALLGEKGVFNVPEKAPVVYLPEVDVSRLLVRLSSH